MTHSTVIYKEVLVPTVQPHVQLTLSIPEAQTLKDLLNYAESADEEESKHMWNIWKSISETKVITYTKTRHQFTIISTSE